MTNSLLQKTPLKKIPRQNRSREMLQRIFSAAQNVLTEQGIKAFTIRNIASEAGIGAASIYDYFPNKRSLLVGFCEKRLQRKLEIFSDYLLGDNLTAPLSENLPKYYNALIESGLFSKLDLELRKACLQDPHLSTILTQFEGKLLDGLCTLLNHYATQIPKNETRAWAKYMLNLDYAAMQIKLGATQEELAIFAKLQMHTSLAILKLAGVEANVTAPL